MVFKEYKNVKYIEKMPELRQEKMPVLIYLHGAGGRRGTLEALAAHPFYGEKSLLTAPDSPLLIFTPLCHANSWFEMFEKLQAFVKMVASREDVDPKRIYLTGASMGGYGAWQLAMTMPDMFAALVPICGGGMYWDAYQLRTTAVWAFHGVLDPVVLPEESVKMVAAINAHPDCIPAKLTLVENLPHNVWEYVFENRELRDWLLAQRKCEERIDPKNLFSGAKQFG